jgi:glyoxylase-like metal-dependent hydrolase (beta-lactamase superfamily II)
MIDAGDLSQKNEGFLYNLSTYLDDLSKQTKKPPLVSKILITHAHQDHIGGLGDVLKLLK